ncbi:MAG TPA: carbohydrate kinase family protein [Chloroflexi bacterium]|nr:carbohydrate kinase family protein [Chloroflexota bacterium]
MTIVCTGSIAYDYLMVFPGHFRDHIIPEKLETISLSFLVESMVRQRGGIAPNIAYTMALLGERPLVMGTVGEDFGDYRDWLESCGVDTRLVKVIPGEYTASFFATTDRSNAQIASFYPGAMSRSVDLSMRDLDGTEVDLVLISPNDPAAMHRYVLECKELGIPYLYDPSQQLVRMDPEEIREGVNGAHSLFLNEYEFELLQKHTHQTAEQIRSQVGFMVVTLGKDGAHIYVDDTRFSIPVVPPRQILDPTGVGDAFRGGFLRGYRLGMPWEICGRMGALAGTYCLEHSGTQNHSFTPAEFVARYREHFDDQGALDVLLN